MTVLHPTDFQSLSLAVRAIVEQCISKEPRNNKYPADLTQEHCLEVSSESVGPPADFFVQWYQHICSDTSKVNIIVVIEEIHQISDVILTAFVQWLGALRNQLVKFCLVTFSSEDLALFKAKVESKGRMSVELYPVYDAASQSALLQVLENVFVLNFPTFDISSQVLYFLREKIVKNSKSATEFLRILKLICFDYFYSNTTRTAFSGDAKYSLDTERVWLNIRQDEYLNCVREKLDIKTLDEFNVHLQRALNHRKVAHGLLQWICTDVVSACSIKVQPLDLYQAAMNGTLSKEKGIENIKSILHSHTSISNWNEMLAKWRSHLELILQDSEWRQEIEDSLSKLFIHTCTETASDTAVKNDSASEGEPCSNKNWNAVKRRKEMLRTLKKQPRRDTHEMISGLTDLLQKCVHFIEETFTGPMVMLFIYSSFTHLLQISGYDTLCRKQWLSKEKPCLECSKYRHCILDSLPKGRRRIWPAEWFERSLQLYVQPNKYDKDSLYTTERDKLWTQFWKTMMELEYCGAIVLSQKSQVLIERTLFD